MFKPGDKVRCIDPANDALKKGDIYTVKEAYSWYVILDGQDPKYGGWYASRFEKVEEEKAMKYVNVKTTTAIQLGHINWGGPRVEVTKTFPGKVQLELGSAGIVIIGKEQALEFSELFKELHDAL